MSVAQPIPSGSSEKWWGLRWVGEELFSPIKLVESCGIRRFPQAAALLTAANWVETSDRLGCVQMNISLENIKVASCQRMFH
jgi:hypothetical protein